MSASDTAAPRGESKKPPKPIDVRINRKYKVTLPDDQVTGLEIKKACVAQGVPIKLDFLVTLEAHDGEPARTVGDSEQITVSKHSKFTINDVDDDS
jgi:hypothetical protein